MPFEWTKPTTAPEAELHLWPHQSLTPEGYVAVIATAAGLLILPLSIALGSLLIWGLLPFLLLALFGLKWALDLNRKHAQILEVLTLGDTDAQLTRYGPANKIQSWNCNRHWVQVKMHDKTGPVPNYVTLQGAGREVEIGAFLSEEERESLFEELHSLFQNTQQQP
ncbi:DUF2244 domain-containing protein [Epibacterium sp. SM1969]|uniref:DUF2244 domain-containing protein n=1 Tax=Tritonibacter aquimaris TaxID=2663379 RepID=A0A844AYY5_9RHOB|nr:DUF2244 domain-containing protein [Tritonibacter aquimaris]MQY43151.1 DUF2244 domain-containing protein [Tritonibacter aquimaris]